MARIAGVNIPKNKRIEIALTYVYGIGLTTSKEILATTKVDPNKRVETLNDMEVNAIRGEVDKLTVEADLHREVNRSIKYLTDIGCYRGVRHRNRLPVRGQRTKTNARTRKGKPVAIAGKKTV